MTPAAALAAPVIEAAVEDPAWTAALGDPAALAAEGAAMALAAARVPADGLSVSVLFADDAAVADLNERFRARTGATNVLSWPAEDLAPDAPGGRPRAPTRVTHDGEPASLGDLALAHGVCAREAAEAGLALRVHALHLVLHGTLHLLGHDHETDEDAALMERLESEAMLAAGLPDPYVARQQTGRPDAAPLSDGSDGR